MAIYRIIVADIQSEEEANRLKGLLEGKLQECRQSLQTSPSISIEEDWVASLNQAPIKPGLPANNRSIVVPKK